MPNVTTKKLKFGYGNDMYVASTICVGKIGTAVAVQHGDRYIFNLVTKEKYNGRPLISSVRKSLESMKEQCNESAVTNLSIPKIGAGLDRLDWGEVKQTVEEVFCDTDIQIVVHVYKPR